MPIRRRETESEYFHRMRVPRWKLETAKKREEYNRRKEIAKQNGNTIHANQEAHLQANLEGNT